MLKQLQDGLVLRSLSEGYESDKIGLPEFYARVFREAGDEDSVEIGNWAKDLMNNHPTTTLDDIWVVVDSTKEDKIVSALLLIPQKWRYDTVEFGMGRVEIVATDMEYRQRGLIRQLMDVAHERSAALGHVMQGITGISHYYRRFGYGMSLDLGGRSGLNLDIVPPLKDDQKPQFTLRQATTDDIPNILEWQESYVARNLVSVVRDASLWEYELSRRSDNVPFKLNIYVIHDVESGEDVGLIAFRVGRFQKFFALGAYIVGEKSSYLETFDDVIRFISEWIEEHFADKPDIRPTRISIDSGHSMVLDTMIKRMTSGVVRDYVYAWYIRMESVARFLNVVKPVLEQRLAGSGANNFTGELKIAFFDLTGVVMKFENGKITDIADETIYQYEWDAAFPYHTFLNVVMGRNRITELETVLPEIAVNRKAAVLFDAMFPLKRSWVMALA